MVHGHVRSTKGIIRRRILAAGSAPWLRGAQIRHTSFCNLLLPLWQHISARDILLEEAGFAEDDDPIFLDLLWREFERDLAWLHSSLVHRSTPPLPTHIRSTPSRALLAEGSDGPVMPPSGQVLACLGSLLTEVDLFELLGGSVRCNPSMTSGARHRDVFPLPLTPALTPKGSSPLNAIVSRMVNFPIVGFNALHRFPGFGIRVTSAHRAIHDLVWSKTLRIVSHIGGQGPLLELLKALEAELGHQPLGVIGGRVVTSGSASRLRADDVDRLAQSGLVDPLPLLPETLQAMVGSPASLFLKPPR